MYKKYIPYLMTPIIWWWVGTRDKNNIRKEMFNRGLKTSQYFKPCTGWDNYVEPLIIKQFSILFTAGNSFIKGMLSDNDNKNTVKKVLQDFKNDIVDEFKDKN